MDKLNMQTTNIVDENIKRIGELFPNCLTERLNDEGKPEVAIDFDQLRQELSRDIVEGPEERYQFTWPDKRNAIRLANAPTTDTLRPCREESVDFDNTQNLYIEGDNLQVLKLLRENYLGKVKMIYIDPPYNTGNDFVYNDNFDQDKQEYVHNSGQYDEQGNQLVTNTESNGRFHTDWLNMIYPRLKVAKDLLSEDGVIFISIDDNEVENLKKVCDEVFGESSLYTTFAWVNSLKETIEEDTKFAGANLGKIKKSHEYVLVYTKKDFAICPDASSSEYIDKLITNGGNNINSCIIKSGIKCVEPINKVFTGRIGGTNDFFDIVSPEGMIIEKGILKNDVEIRGPLRNANMLTRFFNGEEVIDHKGQMLVDVYIGKTGMINTRKLRSGNIPSSVLVGKGTTKNGTLLLKEIFGEKLFDFSKPVELLLYLITKVHGKDFFILDFFSGSATTAHAVMQLNAEDGGKRKFIMVQLPEATDEKSEAYKAGYKNICEIGKERIRRAGKKIKEESPLTTQDLDTGFRVLKLDSSNMQDVYYTPEEFDQRDLFEDNIKSDRTEEDLLFQTMIDLGIELSAKIEQTQIAGKTVWNVSDGYLMACFDEAVNETTITEIAKQQPYYFVMRDKSLANDNVADNFEQIFNHYSKDTIRRII